LDGGAGSDGFSGGAGSDVYVFKTGYGADRVTDFADNVDRLRLDGDLWVGGLTIEQLLNFHEAVVGENPVLEFCDDVLTLIGLSNVSALLDDILIV
jgi:serralysin